MKKAHLYIIVIGLILGMLVIGKSRNKRDISIDSSSDLLNSSYKELKSETSTELKEHTDGLKNIYSNYEYYISFDAPDEWTIDLGVSKHTIFRTFQKDSAITFSINVVSPNISDDEDEITIWELYDEIGEQIEMQFKIGYEKQLNSKLTNYKLERTFLKNNKSIKRSFTSNFNDLNVEYINKSIVFQTIKNNLSYTFSLDVPNMYYIGNPDYYESIFRNIYFLNKDRLLK
jgi:hypothetical protein